MMHSVAAFEQQSPAVLVLFSAHRLLPANVEAEEGLREASTLNAPRQPELFTEFLGAPAFEGELYETKTARFLKEKYAAIDVQAIVAFGQAAVDFLLRHREATFPGIPVVYGGVARQLLSRRTLPDDFIGTPLEHDVKGTIHLARRLHPDVEQLVVVTGAGPWDQERLREAKAAVEKSAQPWAIEYWSGLPIEELKRRLSQLSHRSAVYTPGFYRDGTGANFIPLEAARLISGASSAPVYSIFPTQLGSGVVGGRMTSFVDVGRAARLALDQVLTGASPASVDAPSQLPAPVQLDWREVRRWRVDESLIPRDAVIHFREPHFWDIYRNQVIWIGALVLVQAGLIAALLLERRQRRRMAVDLQTSEMRTDLAAAAAQLSTFEWRVDDASPIPNLPPAIANVHPADRERVGGILRGAASTGAAFEVEYRTVDNGGSVRWNALRGQTRSGAGAQVVGVTMDITARKVAELQAASDRAALTHISRTATLGQLSAAIAHQLNQPLAAILGNAETALSLMRRTEIPTQEMKEILTDIVSENHRAADVIRRLVALYRKGETDLATVDVNALIEETLGLIRAELLLRQVTPELKLRQPSPLVQGSRTQLQQVLLNLVLNAADAMGDTPVDQRNLMVRSSIDADMAVICVADRGIGIEPENMHRVFEPFWSTKSTGLGIGLAICKSIVNAHHGKLVARNQPSGGAEFCFSVPLVHQGTNMEHSHADCVSRG
jgi:signal transduction histidine kinase